MLEQEATAGEEGNPEVSGSESSLADIVGEVWPRGDATESAAPATGSAEAETGKGKESAKTGEPESPRPEDALLSKEQLGKLTIKDISNPSFDWSKVPPEDEPLLKRWQADVTRLNQKLASAKQPERKDQPPQPNERPKAEDGDPIDAQNRKIVADALKDLGIDPKVTAELVEDGIASRGAMLAAQAVPRYAEDLKFQDAVHQAVAADEELIEMAESKDPALIARALKTAAVRVERDELKRQVSSIDQRTKDLDAREGKIKKQEEEIEQLRAKYQRSKPTVAGGGSTAAPSKPSGPADVKQIVDDIWPSQGVRIG